MISLDFDKSRLKNYVKENYDWEVIAGRFIKLLKYK